MLKRVIGEHVALECLYAKNLPAVDADVGMVEQIIINLIVNARDAMPEGGSLLLPPRPSRSMRLSSKPIPNRNRASLRASPSATRARASIRNICRGFLSRSSPPRKPAKAPASAWPWSMASSNSTKDGSKSPANWGTEPPSRLSCPPMLAARLKPLPAPKKTCLAGGHEKILLVEDDADVRMVARDVLEVSGYQIWEAADRFGSLGCVEGPRNEDRFAPGRRCPSGRTQRPGSGR